MYSMCLGFSIWKT